MLQPPHIDHQAASQSNSPKRVAAGMTGDGPWPSSRLAPLLQWCLPALWGLAALQGCTPAPGEPRLEDFNIVMVVVDTVGAKHVGIYNDALDSTPRIDAFSRDSTRFGRAYATAPWTQPSVASILTSRTASGHGVHNIRDVLEAEQVTLAELLRERGYATLGVISHHLIGAGLGYDQGFDTYDESAVGGHTGVSSERVTETAIRHIDTHVGSRFFLFAHYFDPHYNYQHHPPFDRTSSYRGPLADVEDIWQTRDMRPALQATDIDFLKNRHQEEIAFVDHHVGRLLDHLSRSGLMESTIVVLVADHGEELMEHGWIGHTRTLYEELIHVPLVMRIPGRTSPEVVDSAVSTLDILPTLLALSATAADDRLWDGRSLLPVLAGETWPAPREVFADVSFMPPSLRQGEKLAFKTALVQGDLKLIHDRRDDTWELFRLSADPLEQANIADEESATTQRLARRLTAWEQSQDLPTEFTMTPPDDITDEELERLQSLGYVH